MPHARYETDGDVGEIVLSNPPLNLFDATLMAELRAAVDEAAAAAPRALIVRAEGKVFTAGVDVHVFEGLDIPAADALTGSLLELAHTLEDMPFPTLAAVHGLCLTAGLEVALACDLLWASEDARFGLVEKVVGITPLMGGTQRMAERAGTARAREFVYSGALFDAPTLHGWGVVNRVLAEDALLDDARAFAASWRPARPSRTPPPRRSCARRPITAPAARTSARRRSPHTCSRPRIHAMRCRVSCRKVPERPPSPVSE